LQIIVYEGVFLNKRHFIAFGLLTLLVIILSIAISLYFIYLYMPQISIAAVVLLVIGLVTGALIPSILATWIVILLTVAGGAIVLLGDVPMTLPTKLVLLSIFPISAGLMSAVRWVLTRFGWINFNKRDIERYSYHYDQVTKLQAQYNAEKMYCKIVRFIRDDYDQALWCDITAIHWTHSSQLRQFHADDYDQMLREIAKVLKQDRLPSESLYYLGRGTFLIISHQLSHEAYVRRNEYTKAHLAQFSLLGAAPQFKWGTLRVDHSNIDAFPALQDAVSHAQREMETDLVVEYLKGGD
jgi:hypothetical protein